MFVSCFFFSDNIRNVQSPPREMKAWMKRQRVWSPRTRMFWKRTESPVYEGVLVVFSYSEVGDCGLQQWLLWEDVYDLWDVPSWWSLKRTIVSLVSAQPHQNILFWKFCFGNFPHSKLLPPEGRRQVSHTQPSHSRSYSWCRGQWPRLWVSSICHSRSAFHPSLHALSTRRPSCVDYITKVSLLLASVWL